MTKRTFVAVAAGLLILAVYLLRVDRVLGIVGDDAWYALLGRTLARGDGFLQPNAPTAGLLPIVPPGFPLLLAPVWYVSPAFPHNVPLLKIVSIVAMLAAAGLTYLYTRARTDWPRELAAAAAVATALVPSLVWLATSTLMSDCAFLAAQLAALVALERWRTQTGTAVAGLSGAIAVLMRSIGVALPLGVVLYLGATRQWRRAATFTAVVVLLVTPWQLYAHRHAPTPLQQAHGEGPTSYSEQFWMQWAGDPNAGVATLRDIPVRVWQNTVDVVSRDTVAVIAPLLVRAPEQSGLEVLSVGGYGSRGRMAEGALTRLISTVLFGLIGLGWAVTARRRPAPAEIVVALSLAAIVAWPFWSFRFVLPFAPFLLVYLIEALRTLAPTGRRVPLVVILGVLTLSLLDHAGYIVHKTIAQPEWSIYAEDADAVMAWLREHPADGVIATTNPALVYLGTGTSTIQLEGQRVERAALKARGVRYVVSVNPAGFRVPVEQGSVRYLSPRCAFWVLEL